MLRLARQDFVNITCQKHSSYFWILYEMFENISDQHFKPFLLDVTNSLPRICQIKTRLRPLLHLVPDVDCPRVAVV